MLNVQAAAFQIQLCSIGEPVFPSRPGNAQATRSTTDEMGGAEPPVATRSASHCASMARMASTHLLPVAQSPHAGDALLRTPRVTALRLRQ
jgi:hypothetical protein